MNIDIAIDREIANITRVSIADLRTLPADLGEHSLTAAAYVHMAALFRAVILMTKDIDRAVKAESDFIAEVRKIGPHFEAVA